MTPAKSGTFKYMEEYADLLEFARHSLDLSLRVAREHGIHKQVDAVIDDCRQVLEIAALVEYGHIKKASERARNLDTFVREGLPQSFWDLLESRGL